jgi:hypothetical protein
MGKHDKWEDRAKYSQRRLKLAANAELIGLGGSLIIGTIDPRSGIGSGEELA